VGGRLRKAKLLDLTAIFCMINFFRMRSIVDLDLLSLCCSSLQYIALSV